jgi:hypothetical protein
VDVLADVAQAPVDLHRPREKPRLEQDLEPVADAEHGAARGGELRDTLHDRREARECSRPQVVAVGEAAGKNDRVGALQVPLVVPDVVGLAPEKVLRDVKTVRVAVGARKDDDPELHPSTFTS